MIGTDGVVYNMNRMMRITVRAAGKTETIEYCPQADTRLNARLEAVIKYLPTVGTASTRTGWVAKATIYNPPFTLLTLIQKPVWSIDNYYSKDEKGQNAYYNTVGTLQIEAGYWNEKSGIKSREERLKVGRGGYTSLITGYINTSSYYRKGTDNILEIWCFDKSSKANDDFQKQTKSALAKSPGYQDKVVQDRQNNKTFAADEKWYDVIKTVINHFATEKSPTPKIWEQFGVVESEETQTSTSGTLRTAADKASADDFETIYIHPPVDGNPENGYKEDREFQGFAHNTVVGKKLSINAGNIYTAVEEIEAAFPDGGVNIWFNYNHPESDGKTKYYIWPIGKDKNGNIGEDVANEGGVVEIYNFQNMLETPSIDGAGNFTMKMLFNPKIVKNGFVRLRWDKRRFENMISGYTEGVQSTASLSAFHPSLRGGKYNIQTRAYANSDGNVFNAKFRAGYVTHTLSTHKNTWQTEVKTTGVASLP